MTAAVVICNIIFDRMSVFHDCDRSVIFTQVICGATDRNVTCTSYHLNRMWLSSTLTRVTSGVLSLPVMVCGTWCQQQKRPTTFPAGMDAARWQRLLSSLLRLFYHQFNTHIVPVITVDANKLVYQKTCIIICCLRRFILNIGLLTRLIEVTRTLREFETIYIAEWFIQMVDQ